MELGLAANGVSGKKFYMERIWFCKQNKNLVTASKSGNPILHAAEGLLFVLRSLRFLVLFSKEMPYDLALMLKTYCRGK
jgi:hypothetical protein